MAGLSLAETRIVHDFAVRSAAGNPRSPFQGRSRQGVVRLRRRRRQFRLAASRRARPMSCSIICSAKLLACPAPGAMRSAAWARSPRRWPAPAAKRGSTSCSNTPVEEMIVADGRAGGVVAGGKAWRAKRVVAGVNPKLLFDRLVPHGAVDADVAARMHGWKCESATFRMNVALSELPEVHGAAQEGQSFDRGHHHGAQPRLHAPRLARRGGRTAGRNSRSSRC